MFAITTVFIFTEFVVQLVLHSVVQEIRNKSEVKFKPYSLFYRFATIAR